MSQFQKKTVRTITAVLQLIIGFTGVLAHTLQTMHGQPLDLSHIACFFGVALSGQQTLMTVSSIGGGA